MSRLIRWTISAEELEALFERIFKPKYHPRLEWVEFDDLYETMTIEMIVEAEDQKEDGYYAGLCCEEIL